MRSVVTYSKDMNGISYILIVVSTDFMGITLEEEIFPDHCKICGATGILFFVSVSDMHKHRASMNTANLFFYDLLFLCTSLPGVH